MFQLIDFSLQIYMPLYNRDLERHRYVPGHNKKK